MSPSLVRNFVSAVCQVPGPSLSPGRLKWALVAQRTELRAQSEKPSTYKLSCYGQDVMFPAQNEHGFPRMHCEKG